MRIQLIQWVSCECVSRAFMSTVHIYLLHSTIYFCCGLWCVWFCMAQRFTNVITIIQNQHMIYEWILVLWTDPTRHTAKTFLCDSRGSDMIDDAMKCHGQKWGCYSGCGVLVGVIPNIIDTSRQHAAKMYGSSWYHHVLVMYMFVVGYRRVPDWCSHFWFMKSMISVWGYIPIVFCW